MVTHQPKVDRPPEGSIPQTRNLTLKLYLTKLRQGDNSMDGHLPSLQTKDGHPLEGNILQTWNLTLTLNFQN